MDFITHWFIALRIDSSVVFYIHLSWGFHEAFGNEYHGKIPVGLEEFGWLDDYYILTGVYIIGLIELASLVLDLD